MKKLMILGFIATLAIITTGTAKAQQHTRIPRVKREQSHWYMAQPEIQILDERPVVRDFRKAPEKPGTMELPAGPGEQTGGQDSGALPATIGTTLPAEGINIGGSNPGYRTNQDMLPPSWALPKSGFGQSNIPIGGIHPRGINLPPGTNTAVLGKMLSEQKISKSTPVRSAPRHAHLLHSAPVMVSSYGDYSTAGSGYGGMKTETNVRGYLLRGH